MNDPIDRQAAIDVVNDVLAEYIPTFMPWHEGILMKCALKLKALPPAQLQYKKGRWISLDDFRGKYNENGFKCSECGEHSDYEENFCPNCGADMREVK